MLSKERSYTQKEETWYLGLRQKGHFREKEWHAQRCRGRIVPGFFPEQQDGWPTWRGGFGFGSWRGHVLFCLPKPGLPHLLWATARSPFGSLQPWNGHVTQAGLILVTGPFDISDWPKDRQMTQQGQSEPKLRNVSNWSSWEELTIFSALERREKRVYRLEEPKLFSRNDSKSQAHLFPGSVSLCRFFTKAQFPHL